MSKTSGDNMKKIGILDCNELSFPKALLEQININKHGDVTAELMKVDALKINTLIDYDVILDRVSHETPVFPVHAEACCIKRYTCCK